MKRLIVVADNSLIVRAVRFAMRGSEGLEILAYVCGRDGDASRIVAAAPDVVLVDDMNEADHVIDLIRDLKEQADAKVSVMVLTVRVHGPWAERALGAGASGAISKAIQPIALGTLVRESVDGHIVHAPTSVVSSAKPAADASAEPGCLTSRELEILRLAAAGNTNGVIARKLWVTEATVKFHLRNIYRKLDLGNRTEACHYAHVNGLLEQSDAPAPRRVEQFSAA